MHVARSSNVNERDEREKDLELTPTCDPPLRLPEAGPIGHNWWIEPSHPEIDPRAGVPVGSAPDDAPTKPSRATFRDPEASDR